MRLIKRKAAKSSLNSDFIRSLPKFQKFRLIELTVIIKF